MGPAAAGAALGPWWGGEPVVMGMVMVVGLVTGPMMVMLG